MNHTSEPAKDNSPDILWYLMTHVSHNSYTALNEAEQNYTERDSIY